MNVLIVEDETAAATNLKALLLQIDPSIRIEAVIETVVETVRWVKDNPLPDLILWIFIWRTDRLSRFSSR